MPSAVVFPSLKVMFTSLIARPEAGATTPAQLTASQLVTPEQLSPRTVDMAWSQPANDDPASAPAGSPVRASARSSVPVGVLSSVPVAVRLRTLVSGGSVAAVPVRPSALISAAASGSAGQSGRDQPSSAGLTPCPTSPPRHDPFFDVVRAAALGLVVVGHWLMGGFAAADSAGGGFVLQVVNPLKAVPETAPLTWLVGVLGVFLMVGGRLSAASWQRSQAAGSSYADWLKARITRLVQPALATVAVIAGAAGLAWLSGLPWATIWALLAVTLSPLWFIGVYLGLTALTPAAVVLERRLGWAAALLLVGLVGLIDLTRFGPLAPLTPDWLAWFAILPGWGLPFLLGLAWQRRPLSRLAAAGWGLAAGATLLALIKLAGYSPWLTMAGGTDPTRSQTHPPSLAIVAAMTVFCAVLWVFEQPIRRRAASAATVPLLSLASRQPVAILAWHQPLAALPAVLLAWICPSQTVLGLFGQPTGLVWLAARCGWLVVAAAVAAGCVRLSRHLGKAAQARSGWRNSSEVGASGGGRIAGAPLGPSASITSSAVAAIWIT